MRTVDDVIKDWQVAVSGRSRTFPAIPPRDDEIMLAEVLRLRARLAAADRLAQAGQKARELIAQLAIGSDIPDEVICPVECKLIEALTAYTATKGGE